MKSLLALLCISFIGSVFCGVPVLIWESSSITEKEDVVPALSQYDVDEFSNHIIKKVHTHKPLIIVFLEETLSVEDFSWQDAKHQSSFPQVKNITGMSSKVEFIPSVDNPITSLKDLTISHDYVWKKFDGQKLPAESSTILVVKMKDPLNNEDRPEMLRRHDENIADIYSQLLSKHSRIIAIYTGKQSSWVEFESNRVRRDASNEEEKDFRFDDMAIFTRKPPTLSDNGINITLTQTPDYATDKRKGFQRLIMTFITGTEPSKVILRAKFPKESGRWSLSEIEYVGSEKPVVLTPNVKISANLDEQFTSSGPVIFRSEASPNVSLSFSDIAVQAYSNNLLRTSMSGGSSDGPQFFTEAIWSALIVTFVLGIILAWGITMLLDIRTMDRFDDPKGKTITVTATE